MKVEVEVLKYDPNDLDTYPSVCQNAEDVTRRFGYVGGEKLVFNADGSFVGRLVDGFDE